MAEIQRQPVNSSDIASIGYDIATETLEIESRPRVFIVLFRSQECVGRTRAYAVAR